MRIYLLVEGRRTEAKVYKSWLSHIIPELKRIEFFDEPQSNSYFLISANGYPSIIYDLIPASINDINSVGNYDYLVVSLDADEVSVNDRIDEIQDFLSSKNIFLKKAKLVIIVQHKCIETWFLGNRRIVSNFPSSATLREFIAYYDVQINDPELMEKHPDFATNAQFHLNYLKEIFRERNLSYSKVNPGHVLDKTYLDQLIERINSNPTHLNSFQVFLSFCREVKKEIT